MNTAEHDVVRELGRLGHAGFLTPQEFEFLQRVVSITLSGETGRLYQKGLADELAINSPKQVGVLATRLRDKLDQHYRAIPTAPLVRIELPPRGYGAHFVYRPPLFSLSERVQGLVADAKVAIDQRTLPGAGMALTLLDQALRLEPDHALLLALKAYCHATRSLFGTYPRADLEKAEHLVARTQSANPRPWESWFAEACVAMALHWNWKGAGAAFGQALALSNGDAQFQPWYTTFLSCQGNASEAVALQRSAVSRTHDSPIVRADLASALIYAGRLDEAEETLDTALELFNTRAHYLLHVLRSVVFEARGDSRGALKAIDGAPLTWPRTAVTLGFRALFSGLAGDHRTAQRHLLKLRAARAIAGRYVPAGQLGLATLGAGDMPSAVKWLREGAEVERDPNFVLSNVYPFFRHLHADSGFRALVVDAMGLSLPPPTAGSLPEDPVRMNARFRA